MNAMHDIIKTRRRELGLTQKELADRLFISDKTVSRWESGNQLPEAQMVPDLAQALQLSINALYGIKETLAVQKQEAPRCGTVLWYKILMTVGMIFALFAAMGLTKFDIFYQEQMHTMGWRAVCFIQLFSSCTLLIGAQVAYTFVSKHERLCDEAYLRTEIIFGGLAAIEIVFIYLLLLPFSLSIAYDVWYGAVALTIACGAAVFLLWQKRRLRRYGSKCGKAVSRIAVILLIVSVIALIVVFIIAAVNRHYMTDYYTTAQDLNTLYQTEEYYMLETSEHKANFYSYLLAAVPVMAALIILHVENLIVIERHGFIQIDSE